MAHPQQHSFVHEQQQQQHFTAAAGDVVKDVAASAGVLIVAVRVLPRKEARRGVQEVGVPRVPVHGMIHRGQPGAGAGGLPEGQAGRSQPHPGLVPQLWAAQYPITDILRYTLDFAHAENETGSGCPLTPHDGGEWSRGRPSDGGGRPGLDAPPLPGILG